MICTVSIGVVSARAEEARTKPATDRPTTDQSNAPRLPSGERYLNRNTIGINLTGKADWIPEWSLVDVYKYSRPWRKADWTDPSEDSRFEFDEQGNPLLKPGQMVQTLMLREIEGHYPAGVYVTTYQGKGKVALGPSDVKRIVKEGYGRIEAQVDPGDGGIILQVMESDPRDPIRDIHVWMPGFEGASMPFHPLFLERLRPFGTFRFMDWQATNWSPLENWAERARPGDARYSTPKGMPLELMIDLCNRTHTNPWFCMPHRADDEFVRNFAAMVKERLAPDLKIYVEYSNEVWNGQFGQARYAMERGKAQGLGPSDFESQLRYYSQRAVEVFGVWETVIGDSKRLIRVMGAQMGNAWVADQVLGWKKAHTHVDALAVAPYFGNAFGNPQTQAAISKMGLGEFLDALEKEVDGKNREGIGQQAEVARKYGVELVAYEGGQHLVGVGGAENNEALTSLFIAANRSPRMYDLYARHLGHWFEAGGGLYVAFSNVTRPTKWGSWGLLEYQDQPIEAAPKYRATVDFIKSTNLHPK